MVMVVGFIASCWVNPPVVGHVLAEGLSNTDIRMEILAIEMIPSIPRPVLSMQRQ